MRVKICGITNEEDALAAVNAGADAVGFVFQRSSPRYVDPGVARAIVRRLPPFVTPVGVFVNCDRTEILEVIEKSGIRCLQFHGEESPEEIEGYPVPVYKAFRVQNGFAPMVLQSYRAAAYLLDTFVEGRHGGTGQAFDRRIALEAKQYGRIILSGGLSPENIVEAVREVAPYAVDVNSGVESSPGKKDKARLHKLFNALKSI